MASKIETRLGELGITLPPPGAPGGNYVPFVVVGDLAFMAGQVAREAGKMKFTGKVGKDVSIEQGQEAARLCAVSFAFEISCSASGNFSSR